MLKEIIDQIIKDQERGVGIQANPQALLGLKAIYQQAVLELLNKQALYDEQKEKPYSIL